MIRSLRTDFGEFMSSLKEDSSLAAKAALDDATHVLGKIDDTVATGAAVVARARKKSSQKNTDDVNDAQQPQHSKQPRLRRRLSEAEQEALHRMGLMEVYTLPLELPPSPSSSATDLTLLEDEEEEEEDNEDKGFDIAREEKTECYPPTGECESETELINPEDRELQTYLATFNIDDKTSEIAALLEQQDTLREIFSELVPCEVSYVDFWLRHFWRCDPVRIEAAWARQAAIQREKRRWLLHKVLVRPLAGVLSQNKTKDAGGDHDQNDPDDDESPTTQQQQAALEHTLLRELEGMQHAMAASNQRIHALRATLDDTRHSLQQAQCQAAGLQQQLDETRAELQAKVRYVAELEDKLASCGMGAHAVMASEGKDLAEEEQLVGRSSLSSALESFMEEEDEEATKDTAVEDDEKSTKAKVVAVPAPVVVTSAVKEEEEAEESGESVEEVAAVIGMEVEDDEDDTKEEKGGEDEEAVTEHGGESVETEESASNEQHESFQSPVKTKGKAVMEMMMPAKSVPSPTSILDTIKVERSSMFKFATSRLFRTSSSTCAKPEEAAEQDDDDNDDDGSIESGWGDDSDIGDAEIGSLEEEDQKLQTNRELAEELGW